MKLQYAPTSPFVRKVMVLLHETGHLDDVTPVAVATTPVSPDAGLSAKNPLLKIPALERENGPTLYDSRVICSYLDDLWQTGLYPSGARRWDTKTLEATADGIMDAAVLMTYEGRIRPEEKQWDGWVEAQWAKISSAISALNNKWVSHLSGSLDMGQIAVACALAYVDFRHAARDWRTSNPDLAAWYATFSERPSMVATKPPAG